MASTDLDHIRALLVAQTAETEPQPKGLFGRLFATQAEAPPSPSKPPRFTTVPELGAPVESAPCPEHEQELLLEHIVRPTLGVETAAPLPPPPPRGEFGRRPDLAPEPELILDQPATVARRLQLLDVSGQPVGEMILSPDEPKMRVISPAASEEVPFFPEDFLDDDEHPGEPQPLRPWLKALRRSGLVKPADAATAAARQDESGPPIKRGRARGAKGREPPPKSAPRTLGHDLLEALAITLAREQENLVDRLHRVAHESVFRDTTVPQSAAA